MRLRLLLKKIMGKSILLNTKHSEPWICWCDMFDERYEYLFDAACFMFFVSLEFVSAIEPSTMHSEPLSATVVFRFVCKILYLYFLSHERCENKITNTEWFMFMCLWFLLLPLSLQECTPNFLLQLWCLGFRLKSYIWTFYLIKCVNPKWQTWSGIWLCCFYWGRFFILFICASFVSCQQPLGGIWLTFQSAREHIVFINSKSPTIGWFEEKLTFLMVLRPSVKRVQFCMIIFIIRWKMNWYWFWVNQTCR